MSTDSNHPLLHTSKLPRLSSLRNPLWPSSNDSRPVAFPASPPAASILKHNTPTQQQPKFNSDDGLNMADSDKHSNLLGRETRTNDDTILTPQHTSGEGILRPGSGSLAQPVLDNSDKLLDLDLSNKSSLSSSQPLNRTESTSNANVLPPLKSPNLDSDPPSYYDLLRARFPAHSDVYQEFLNIVNNLMGPRC